MNVTELRSCVKVEVDVLGSPSHIVLMVSMDVKQHWKKLRAQELYESRGGRPEIPPSLIIGTASMGVTHH